MRAMLAEVSFASTASLFRAGAYAEMIGTVETVLFAPATQRLDRTCYPSPPSGQSSTKEIVRMFGAKMTERRAPELLGRDPDLGGSRRGKKEREMLGYLGDRKNIPCRRSLLLPSVSTEPEMSQL